MKAFPQTLMLIALASLLAGCKSTDEAFCTIEGEISSCESADSSYVHWMPFNNPSYTPYDSAMVINNHFTLKIEAEDLAIIHKSGLQDLLVISEPGNVKVTIGAVSSSSGTPQNDSLQLWKELIEAHNKEMSDFYKAGLKERADSSHKAFKARTIQLAHNVGDDSTLGKFLTKLYPGEI